MNYRQRRREMIGIPTTPTTLRERVFQALDTAREENGYDMRADPVDSVCQDLVDCCSDFEGYEPTELRQHVAEWQQERKDAN
jgi:hypothetical protein